MVAYEVSGNRDLMIHCAKMTVAIDGPLSMSSVEDGRLLMQFHELLSSHYPQTNQESVCLREAREKSYKGKKRFFLLDISNKTGLVRSFLFCLKLDNKFNYETNDFAYTIAKFSR